MTQVLIAALKNVTWICRQNDLKSPKQAEPRAALITIGPSPYRAR